MYAFTAAHRTLPLPSYARVTNLSNGRSIVVRVNDRGPFHSNRIIDLSYAAAVKLGYRERGTARVRVEALTPEDLAAGASARPAPTPPTQPAPTAMDRLVSGLPAAAANAPTPQPEPSAPTALAQPAALQVATAAPAAGNRFYMQQDGRNRTAAEFAAWMHDRGIHVATGRPQTTSVALRAPDPVPTVAAVPAPPQPATVANAEAAIAAPATSESGAPAADPQAVVLQVASFSSEENARHALSLLLRAAVTQARILVADVGGRQVWRLRVGPVDPETAPELASRIEGLGLGRPRRVAD